MTATTGDARSVACGILRRLGLRDGPLEPAESFSHAAWMTPEHVVRYHVIGPAGRLEHEARVAAGLPPEALYPRVVACGRDGDHDWLVTERVQGVRLVAAWPGLSPERRREAIRQAADALRAIHRTSPLGQVPPCLFGGAPVTQRSEYVDRILGAYALSSPEADAVVGLAAAIDDEPAVLAHGDFSPNQVVHDGDCVVALLDLEMSHAEAADWDLWPFLAFCADPVRAVPQDLEALASPDLYRDAPAWLREAYPELFAHRRLRERLRLYELLYRAEDLRSRPDAVASIRAVLAGRGVAEQAIMGF